MNPFIDELTFNIDPDYTSDDTSVKAIALQNPELRGRSPRTPFVSAIRDGRHRGAHRALKKCLCFAFL